MSLFNETPLNKIAYDNYNHYPPATRDSVNFILFHLDERKVGILKNIYSYETQFTCHQKLREKWNEWYKDPEEQLTGTQENILIYLLDMYGCMIAKKLRKKKNRKRRH